MPWGYETVGESLKMVYWRKPTTFGRELTTLVNYNWNRNHNLSVYRLVKIVVGLHRPLGHQGFYFKKKIIRISSVPTVITEHIVF